MIVISDNSALSGLAEAGLLELLPRMFGVVVIPEAVHRESMDPGAPAELRRFMSQSPDWLQVEPDPEISLPETVNLDPGEAAAITLAWGHRWDCRLLLDEKSGRRVAAALGLPMTGVVGLVGDAAKLGLLEFNDAIARLRTTGFYITDQVIETVRQRLG